MSRNTLLRTVIQEKCSSPSKTRITIMGAYMKICRRLETAMSLNADLEEFLDKLSLYLRTEEKIQQRTVSYDDITYMLADQAVNYKLDKLSRILTKAIIKHSFRRVFNYETSSNIS